MSYEKEENLYNKKKLKKEEYYNDEYQKNDKINYLDYYSDIRQNDTKEENITQINNEKGKKELNNKNSIKKEQITKGQVINIYSNDNNTYNNDNEELTDSIKEILLDKEFASPIIIKKENHLITNFHYVTFQNLYGENACYINVILHLIYRINELYEFLTSLYQIDESNKGIKISRVNKNSNSQNNNNNLNNKFLVLLGRILYQYESIINEENNENERKNNNKKNQVTVLKTLPLRRALEQISFNKFPLNNIADPVELFTFILDILNENLKEALHKTFYLELIDEFSCEGENNCQITIKNKYDKDNFIYHIYIDEILKYIEKENIKIKNYKNKLFEYSYKLFLKENTKKCEKCKEDMNHNLVCMNYPDYLLINCVWKESNPIVDDVITFFFLISLKDELNNLFVCYNKRNRKKISYYLFGFILYSFTLSHYIICIFNYEKNVFVLYDDEVIKEYKNIYNLLIDITVNTLKFNGKAFFYPVMLIFTQENLYDNKIIRLNVLNDSDYMNIINRCNEAIFEYRLKNNINDEEKIINYEELIEKQKEIENSIKNKDKKLTENNDDSKIDKKSYEIEIREKNIKNDDNKNENNYLNKINKEEKNELNNNKENEKEKEDSNIEIKDNFEDKSKVNNSKQNEVEDEKINDISFEIKENEEIKINNNKNNIIDKKKEKIIEKYNKEIEYYNNLNGISEEINKKDKENKKLKDKDKEIENNYKNKNNEIKEKKKEIYYKEINDNNKDNIIEKNEKEEKDNDDINEKEIYTHKKKKEKESNKYTTNSYTEIYEKDDKTKNENYINNQRDGLNKINKIKIVQILSDIQKVKGGEDKSNIFLENLRNRYKLEKFKNKNNDDFNKQNFSYNEEKHFNKNNNKKWGKNFYIRQKNNFSNIENNNNQSEYINNYRNKIKNNFNNNYSYDDDQNKDENELNKKIEQNENNLNKNNYNKTKANTNKKLSELYISNRQTQNEDENNNNKEKKNREIYKKRTNLQESRNYHYNLKHPKSGNIPNTIDYKFNNLDNNKDNDDNRRDIYNNMNNITISGTRNTTNKMRKKYLYQTNAREWNTLYNKKNKSRSIESKDDIIKDEKNYKKDLKFIEKDNSDKDNKDIDYKKVTNDNEYIYTKTKNKNIITWTPMKKTNHTKLFQKSKEKNIYEDKDNNNFKYNKSEKKKFIGRKFDYCSNYKKNKKEDDDNNKNNNTNSNNKNKEDDNDESSNNIQRIRRKIYSRANKE